MELGQLERRTPNYVRNGTLDLFAAFIDEICGFLGEDEPQRLTAAV